eukprot:g7467.t1
MDFVLYSLAVSALPSWPATYNLSRSTFLMPCNYSGFFDPQQAAAYGIADFDWSNAKSEWAAQRPMDCEERLVQQARMIKAINPDTRVFVYRNLVKALPWYTGVREKLTDPRYAGWFLPFKPGGSLPDGSYHVPPCTPSVMGAPTKCSPFYHDQEQTPQPFAPVPVPAPAAGWGIIEPGKIPLSAGGQPTGGWVVYQTTTKDTYQRCAAAAAAAAASTNASAGGGAPFFSWWGDLQAPTVYRCWLASQADWDGGYVPEARVRVVSGFRGVPRPRPPVSPSGRCPGDCDCGPGVPCGEYLWDHRNASLRQFLLNEVVLGNRTGLGNVAVDGFYFDDGWSDRADPPPPGQPASYRSCDSSPVGGATEEDAHCVADMGLGQADTTALKDALAQTMSQALAAIVAHGGWTTREMPAYAVHTTDPAQPALDPRPPARCNAFMRQYCRADNPNLNSTFTYEWTRKSMHDISPIPAVMQDLARFLLVRGPYAYIGWQWVGCRDVYERPPELENDYGTPVDAVCHETAPGTGVYEREWTAGTVRMDCNTWTATLPQPL